MALQVANENLVVAVAGCSGSGKSTFVVCYLGNEPFTCRFIFDPGREYAPRFNMRPCSTVAELNAAVVTGWVIFQPHLLFPGEPEKALECFCEWAWTVSLNLPGQKILFCDEIWKYCNPSKIPRPLALIVQDGRKNGIGLVCSTQRPNRMNEAIIGEATEFIGFRLVGENKLDYLRKNLDEFPVDELPKLLLVDKVQSHFMAQNLRTGSLRRYVLDFQTGKTRRVSLPA